MQLRLDNVTISRLCRLGYLNPDARSPAVIRAAAAAALADHLAPRPERADEAFPRCSRV